VRLRELVERAEGGLVPIGVLPADPLVTSVVTTDLLDPRRYLTGGELVLTGLAWWRPDQPGRSRGFVAALVGAGAAGLAAGEAEFGAVPPDLVEACAEAGLPLLRVPVAHAFAAITERATRQLTGQEDLVDLLRRHQSLVAAIAAREQGHAALDGVLSMLERDVGLRCWVMTPAGRLVAGVAGDLAVEDRRRLVRVHLVTTGSTPRAVRSGNRQISLVPAPPTVARGVAWLLAIEGDAPAGVVDVVASLVALERDLTLRRSDREVELAGALDRTSPAEVTVALQRCGLDPEATATVVVGQGDCAAAVLAEALTDHLRWAMGERPGEALAVVATDDPAALVSALSSVVDALSPGLGAAPLRLGVSDAVSGAPALLGAVAEARAVAAAATGSSPHTVSGPDRLASHSVLLGAVPVELRRAYRGRVLGPLLEHDRVHRTDLVRTLETYLDCSGSWSRCAERMHVHVNTLRYRIERIETLTGRDLRNLVDQADLLLALHID
jgi:hypothetical protein